MIDLILLLFGLLLGIFIHELGHYLMIKKLFPAVKTRINYFDPVALSEKGLFAYCVADLPKNIKLSQKRMIYYAGFYLETIFYLIICMTSLLFRRIDFALAFLIILFSRLIMGWNVLFGWFDDDAKNIFKE